MLLKKLKLIFEDLIFAVYVYGHAVELELELELEDVVS